MITDPLLVIVSFFAFILVEHHDPIYADNIHPARFAWQVGTRCATSAYI
jgi:hypothetical protein